MKDTPSTIDLNPDDPCPCGQPLPWHMWVRNPSRHHPCRCGRAWHSTHVGATGTAARAVATTLAESLLLGRPRLHPNFPVDETALAPEDDEVSSPSR